MGYELKAGDICRIQKNLVVDGKRAFDPGCEVRIEAVDPDRQRPGYKYIVFSPLLRKQVRLRGMDLERKYCPRCQNELNSVDFKCDKCGWVVPGKDFMANESDLEKFYEQRSQTRIHRYPWFG